MPRLKERSVLPGFGLSLGYTVVYLSVLVLIPLALLFFKSMSGGWEKFQAAAFAPETIAGYKVTFGCSLIAATINLFAGLLVAWVLVRYRFPGKNLVDALVDLPFALPTAVGGIALAAAYAPEGIVGKPAGELFAKFAATSFGNSFLNSGFGKFIESALSLDYSDFRIAFTRVGIIIALIFISLPFMVRTVQPVLQELDEQIEEAAASLGAGRWATFRRVILPYLFPALVTGFTLGFARAVGEYGSVIFISSNIPMKTQIAPQLIYTKLEQFNYEGATSIGVVMLVASFVLLLTINALQNWTSRRSAA